MKNPGCTLYSNKHSNNDTHFNLLNITEKQRVSNGFVIKGTEPYTLAKVTFVEVN